MIIPPGSFAPNKNFVLTQKDEVVITSPIPVRDIIVMLKTEYERKIKDFFLRVAES